jgi:hypothetical protein
MIPRKKLSHAKYIKHIFPFALVAQWHSTYIENKTKTFFLETETCTGIHQKTCSGKIKIFYSKMECRRTDDLLFFVGDCARSLCDKGFYNNDIFDLIIFGEKLLQPF